MVSSWSAWLPAPSPGVRVCQFGPRLSDFLCDTRSPSWCSVSVLTSPPGLLASLQILPHPRDSRSASGLASLSLSFLLNHLSSCRITASIERDREFLAERGRAGGGRGQVLLSEQVTHPGHMLTCMMQAPPLSSSSGRSSAPFPTCPLS